MRSLVAAMGPVVLLWSVPLLPLLWTSMVSVVERVAGAVVSSAISVRSVVPSSGRAQA